jgi:hypothetical protein
MLKKGDNRSKFVTMNRKNASLIVLFSFTMLFSTLLYSCESNQEPAYAGKWVAMDSSLFYTKDSLVRKVTYDIGESNFTITYSSINDTAKTFIDSTKIKGKLSVIAESMTFQVKEFSVIPDTTKKFVTLKSSENDYKRVSEEYKIDTLLTYKFRVVNSSTLLLKIGDAERKYHRE